MLTHSFGSMNESETYAYIEKIVKSCVQLPEVKEESISEKIDKIVLNKFLAYPIFLALLWVIFKFTFDWVGAPLQDWLEGLITEDFAGLVAGLLENSSPWFSSLIVDGIIGGVGGILTFIPII